jgi:tRNA-2-methylthio-N6-dimethylallyladenosine synthase
MSDCDAVCEHLHFPVQSGSNSCLRRMKRAYSRERYLDKVAMAREFVPGLALTTDIIVGFPGETEEEFADTLSLVESVRYDSAYMFQFSPRPGTDAATMSDQIAKPVTQERFDRLVAGQERISRERNEELVGMVVELTIERRTSKKQSRRATGRTRSNKLVHIEADGAQPGDVVRARVAQAEAHYLLGTVVA